MNKNQHIYNIKLKLKLATITKIEGYDKYVVRDELENLFIVDKSYLEPYSVGKYLYVSVDIDKCILEEIKHEGENKRRFICERINYEDFMDKYIRKEEVKELKRKFLA